MEVPVVVLLVKIRVDLDDQFEHYFRTRLANGLRKPRMLSAGSRSMALGWAWTLLGSRKNLKPRVREMLAVGAADRASELLRRVSLKRTPFVQLDWIA